MKVIKDLPSRRLIFPQVVLVTAFIYLSSCSQKLVQEQPFCYFQSIPVERLTESKLPCISVQIEEHVFLAEFDLGFQGGINVKKNLADEIQNKKFVRSRKTYGIRGAHQQAEHIYEIPKIQIGGVRIKNARLSFEDQEEHSYQVLKEGQVPISSEMGLMGWELFGSTCLFLDFKNSELFCCDSFETFQIHRKCFNEFVSIPFSLGRDLIEFIATVDGKFQRCILDTGCTWNVLNHADPEDRPLEQIAFLPENNSSSNLQIGEEDFGNNSFHLLPLKFPANFDMILGMDFLKDHRVFIDFPNKMLYFEIKESE